MDMSGYVYSHGIVCKDNEQEWTLDIYLDRGRGEMLNKICVIVKLVISVCRLML